MIASHAQLFLFGPAPQRDFSVSSAELKTKYKNLMKELHPDKHASLSEAEKSRKSSLATDVTLAYSIIEDPLLRALHLLELWGVPIDETDKVSV
jgi:molecular chaperone HscB